MCFVDDDEIEIRLCDHLLEADVFCVKRFSLIIIVISVVFWFEMVESCDAEWEIVEDIFLRPHVDRISREDFEIERKLLL